MDSALPQVTFPEPTPAVRGQIQQGKGASLQLGKSRHPLAG